MDDNNTNSTCFDYNSPRYVALAILSASIASVSFLACILVIAGIVLYKKYLFSVQRLILYLGVAAMLSSASMMLRLHRIARDTELKKALCTANGFMEQVSSWWELLAISCITLRVFMKVVLGKSYKKTEWGYLFIIVVLPLTFNWIPFIKSAYGQAGAWCWIRNQDNKNNNCKSFETGNYMRFGLWYIPFYMLLFSLIVGYGIIIAKIHSIKKRWGGSDFDTQQMLKEVHPLLWYPVIYVALSIFALVNRIQGAITPNPVFTLWVLEAIFVPMRGGFICLAYALDSDTVQHLKCRNILARVRSSPRIEDYEHTTCRVTDSLIS